jgi:hypothetical protein
VILRCTKKLLDVIKPSELASDPPHIEDWYGNLLWLDGRKCLLLTHADTLFTIFDPDVRAGDMRDTGRPVTGLIARELAREGLPPGTFGPLDSMSVRLAKTADRSVMGCMTDMADRCAAAARTAGGLAGTDIADVNQALRRNSNSARGYAYPIELVTRRLTAASRGLPGLPPATTGHLRALREAPSRSAQWAVMPT